jgi:hypothetical protein
MFCTNVGKNLPGKNPPFGKEEGRDDYFVGVWPTRPFTNSARAELPGNHFVDHTVDHFPFSLTIQQRNLNMIFF